MSYNAILSDPTLDPVKRAALLNHALLQQGGLAPPDQPQSQPEEPSVPPLAPQDESDLLSQIGAVGGGALGYIGDTLDKTFGGRTVRGLLGGQGLGSLAHLIPFSDTLGLTAPGILGTNLLADKTKVPDGRGLLEQAGVVDPKQPGDGFDLGDVAGIATQALLDPAMYLTPFGLSKGGKLAEELGILPKWDTGLDKLTGGLIKGANGPLATGVSSTLGEALSSATPEIQQAAQAMAAKKGVDLAELGSQPLRGGVGVGLPIWGTDNLTTLGHGSTTQAVGNALDAARLGIRYSKPGRIAASLFDVPSRGTLTPPGQIAAREGFESSKEANIATKLQQSQLAQKAEDVGLQPSMTREGQSVEQAQRAVLEKTLPGGDRLAENRTFDEAAAANLPGATDAQRAATIDVMSQQNALNASKLAQEEALGFNSRLKDPTVNYAAREGVVPDVLGNAGGSGRSFPTDGTGAREELYKGWAPTDIAGGGTDTLRMMQQDERLWGEGRNIKGLPVNNDEARDIVWRDYGLGADPANDAVLTNYRKSYAKIPDDELPKVLSAQYGDATEGAAEAEKMLAVKKSFDQAGEMAAQLGKGKMPAFPNDPITDALRGSLKADERIGYGGAIQRLFARSAAASNEGVPLMEALGKNYMSGDSARQSIAKALMNEGKLSPEQFSALKSGMTSENAYKEAKQIIGGLRVPQDAFNDAKRVMDFIGKGPEATKELGGWFRAATQLTKAWQTATWPANKVRDITTGFWNQLVGDAHYADMGRVSLGAWAGPRADIETLLGGKDIVGAEKNWPHLMGMTNKQANDALRQELFASKVIDPSSIESAVLDTPGAVAPNKSLTKQLVGADPFEGYLKEGLKGLSIQGGLPAEATLLDKLKETAIGVRGVGKRVTDTSAPIAAGRRISDQIFDANNGAMYLAYRRNGMPIEQAAAKTKAINVDFSRLTQFEKKVMQGNLVPYYAWSRHSIPWQLKEVISHPGGITANAVKLAGHAGEPPGFIPKQLEGDLALPLSGEDEKGNKKYLAGFDLPFETLDEAFHPGRTFSETVGNTLADWGGQLNPALRVPIELATNRQLYTGRDLSDLHGRAGQILGTLTSPLTGTDKEIPLGPVAEDIISSGPFSRPASTLGKLLDPRKSLLEKGLNTLTGIKTTDVDMPSAREIAARDAASVLLQGAPGVHKYTDLYVKKQDLPMLSPQDLKVYQLYQRLGVERKARLKADAAKQTVAP